MDLFEFVRIFGRGVVEDDINHVTAGLRLLVRQYPDSEKQKKVFFCLADILGKEIRLEKHLRTIGTSEAIFFADQLLAWRVSFHN